MQALIENSFFKSPDITRDEPDPPRVAVSYSCETFPGNSPELFKKYEDSSHDNNDNFGNNNELVKFVVCELKIF